MAAAKKTPCRIISAVKLDGVDYTPNQVVEFPTAMLTILKDQGVIDRSKAAVDYCLNELGAQVVAHGAAEDSDPA